VVLGGGDETIERCFEAFSTLQCHGTSIPKLERDDTMGLDGFGNIPAA
jgi:hypothetical protein